MKLLPLTHRVEGTVVDQAGKPIAGVEVNVTSLPYPIDGTLHFMIDKTDRLLAPAITDNTGRFVLLLPEGVNAGLRASHPRYFGPGTSAKADSAVLDPSDPRAGRRDRRHGNGRDRPARGRREARRPAPRAPCANRGRLR